MHVCRWVLAVALAAPLAAQAQTISSSFASATADGKTGIVYVGKTRCVNTQQIDFRIDWGTNPPVAGVNTVEFWVLKDAASCTNTSAPATGSKLPAAPQYGVQVQTVFADMATLLQGLTDGCNNTTASAAAPYSTYFCVRTTTTQISTTVTGQSMTVSFALNPPKAPSPPSATPGDSHLKLSWTSNDVGDHFYDVFAFRSGTAVDPNSPASTNIAGMSFDLQNASDGSRLVNDQPYDLYVRSTDVYNNTSGLSAAGTGTPIKINDFWAVYKEAGGSAEGGCASGGADLVAAAAALLALAWRKGSRRALLAVAVIAVPAARAEVDWTGLDRRPRRMLFAFKMDRYSPQVDSEFGTNGANPYWQIFHGRAPPRYQLEVDWEVAHPYGSILVGGTVGFWQNSGYGLVATTGARSSDTARLTVLPIGFVATYRFDVLADRYRWLPVIPYVQAGLQAAYWRSVNGIGDVSNGPNGRGDGWSYGYTTALGFAISLDAIDASLAREAYNDAGVQRTSLFAEYGWTRLDNFHKRGALILSDRAWRFGLSVEF